MKRTALLICGLALLAARTAMAETLEEAIEKMTAAHQKLKSATASLKMTQNMDMGGENVFTSEGRGTQEWARKGDKLMHRMDMKSHTVQKAGGQENKFEQISTSVSDGENFYAYNDMAGMKSATKQKLDPTLDDSPKGILINFKDSHTLKLLSDEKVDGEECWVVECAAKEAEGNPITKQIIYFRKDCGLQVRMDGKDKNDKTVTTYLLSDIKLNTELAPDRFVFKAPEGVEVMDVTPAPGSGKQP